MRSFRIANSLLFQRTHKPAISIFKLKLWFTYCFTKLHGFTFPRRQNHHTHNSEEARTSL